MAKPQAAIDERLVWTPTPLSDMVPAPITNSDAFSFLQDCLIVEQAINPGNLEGVRLSAEPVSCTAPELLPVYQNWCLGAGKSTGSAPFLARNLKSILPKMGTKRVGKLNLTTYSGIGIAKND